MLSVEKPDLSVCVQRTDAEKAAVQAAGVAADRIYPVSGGGAVDIAQAATGPVVTAHPDVTKWIIAGCNDESVLGAINALSAAGVAPADIIGVGLGAYEACRPWAAGQDTGFKGALFISGLDVGAAAAEVLYDNVVNGSRAPPDDRRQHDDRGTRQLQGRHGRDLDRQLRRLSGSSTHRARAAQVRARYCSPRSAMCGRTV